MGLSSHTVSPHSSHPRAAQPEIRKTGIGVVGDVPWGTHFFLFYETKGDLLDSLVPYFKAGLENGEFCVWVISEPLTEAEMKDVLRQSVPGFDRYLARHCIEFANGREFYLNRDDPDLQRVMRSWSEKLAYALANGYAGLRLSAGTAWLEKRHWKAFIDYEGEVNDYIARQKMIALCSYPLSGSAAAEILDVARTHQFAIARRNRDWEVVETSELKQAKAEIKKINDELELRVTERTLQLTLANEELRNQIRERQRAESALEASRAELAHVARVTTMGELTASLAHEVNQPIAAAAADASTCLRWLTREQPDLEEARAAASRIIKDATRATQIISRIRLLFRKGAPQREPVDINEVIREMIVLLRSETARYSISVRTELAEDLPRTMGDRVQLQQVMMNLISNSIDAMKGVGRARDLVITSRRGDDDRVVVSVSDTGLGLPQEQKDQIFNAFFTTKPHGTGMGLSITRSIVQSHGGQISALPANPYGAIFQFTLPVGRDEALVGAA
jgi:C4-dicarboxylate-specific signal transduction histidine kinase